MIETSQTDTIQRLMVIGWLPYLPDSTVQRDLLAAGLVERFDRQSEQASTQGNAIRLTAAGRMRATQNAPIHLTRGHFPNAQ